MKQVDSNLNDWQGALDATNGQTLTNPATLINTLNSAASVVIDLVGKSTLFVDVRCTVTFNAATNLVIEGTQDGVNFFQLPFCFAQSNDQTNFPAESWNNVLGGANVTNGDIFLLCCSVTGFKRVQVRMNFTTAGTATVAMRATAADYRIIAQPQPTLLWVTATAAAGSGATATLPAAGAGLFHYITAVNGMRNATAALAGTATLLLSTTNLPGNPVWSVGNAMIAGGTQRDVEYTFPNPLKSLVANTATTFVYPAPGAAVLVRWNIGYYVGA